MNEKNQEPLCALVKSEINRLKLTDLDRPGSFHILCSYQCLQIHLIDFFIVISNIFTSPVAKKLNYWIISKPHLFYVTSVIITILNKGKNQTIIMYDHWDTMIKRIVRPELEFISLTSMRPQASYFISVYISVVICTMWLFILNS